MLHDIRNYIKEYESVELRWIRSHTTSHSPHCSPLPPFFLWPFSPQIFETLLLTGMHAKQATHSFLTTKHILGSNMDTLRMTSSLIDDSMEQLKQASSSICSIFSNSPNISTSHAKDRSNLIVKDFPLQRSLLSNLTKNLNGFVKAHLPGRKRLSVAIGLARFVDDQSSYKSFAQPLIQAIIKLFNHLDYQSNIERTLLHFISFQNSFIRTCDKVLETHRLLSFGPRFSTISFSQLIPATVLLPLINDLNFDFSRNMSNLT